MQPLLRRPEFSRLLIALGWFIAMMLPLIFLALDGASIIPLGEEAIGYRYFYSLRVIYGHEDPWLPQGQTMGIIHNVVQHGLTWAGYAINDITGRIQMFIWIVAGLGVGCASVLVYLALNSFRSIIGRVLFAAIVCFACTSTLLPQYWYIYPDYHIWILCVALLSLWLFHRWYGHISEIPPLKIWLVLAVLAGVSAGIKVTVAVYAITLGTYWLVYSKNSAAIKAAGIVVMAATSLIIFFFMILGFYMQGWHVFNDYIQGIIIFSGSQSATFGGKSLAFFDYLGLLMQGFPHDVLWLLPVEVVIASCGIFSRRLRPLLCLLPALFLVGYFQYLRFYFYTSIETDIFVIFSLGILVICLRGPFLEFLTRQNLKPRKILLAAQLPLLGAIVYLISQALPLSYSTYLETSLPNIRAFETLNASARTKGKNIFYLAPGNENRISSIYSSMCKGGTDIFSNIWGVDSPFMAKTFPWFRCATYSTGLDFSYSDTLVLRRPSEDKILDTLRRAEKHFKTPIRGWRCADIAPVPLGSIIVCTKTKR